jgi:hypothetical protein
VTPSPVQLVLSPNQVILSFVTFSRWLKSYKSKLESGIATMKRKESLQDTTCAAGRDSVRVCERSVNYSSLLDTGALYLEQIRETSKDSGVDL